MFNNKRNAYTHDAYSARTRARRRVRCLCCRLSSRQCVMLTSVLVTLVLMLTLVTLLAYTVVHIGPLTHDDYAPQGMQDKMSAVPSARDAVAGRTATTHGVYGLWLSLFLQLRQTVHDLVAGGRSLWQHNAREEWTRRSVTLTNERVLSLLLHGRAYSGEDYYARTADALVGVRSRVGLPPDVLQKLNEVQHVVDAVRRRALRGSGAAAAAATGTTSTTTAAPVTTTAQPQPSTRPTPSPTQPLSPAADAVSSTMTTTTTRPPPSFDELAIDAAGLQLLNALVEAIVYAQSYAAATLQPSHGDDATATTTAAAAGAAAGAGNAPAANKADTTMDGEYVAVDDVDKLHESSALHEVTAPVSAYGEREGSFVRAAGASAEVQVLRPFDDIAMLAYRHTLLTLHAEGEAWQAAEQQQQQTQSTQSPTTPLNNNTHNNNNNEQHHSRCDADARLRLSAEQLRVLRQSSSVLNRRYYYPRRRWQRVSPYTREFVAEGYAWVGAVAVEAAYVAGDARAFALRARQLHALHTDTLSTTTGAAGVAAVTANALSLPPPFRVALPSMLRLRHVVARYARSSYVPVSYVYDVAAAAAAEHDNRGGADNARAQPPRRRDVQHDGEYVDEMDMRVQPHIARDAATIFVNFASYRDKECARTLHDVLYKAAHVHRVFVGVAEQYATGDAPCMRPDLLRPMLCYAPRAAYEQQQQQQEGDDNEGEEGQELHVDATTAQQQQQQRAAMTRARLQRNVAAMRRVTQRHRRGGHTTNDDDDDDAYAVLLSLAQGEADEAAAATTPATTAAAAMAASPRTRAVDAVRGVCYLSDHVRLRRIRSSKAFGPTYGRYMAMLLYRGESRVLVMDSHMRFRPHWDSLLVYMHTLHRSSMAVLSHYPENYVQLLSTTTTTTTTTTAPPLLKGVDGHAPDVHTTASALTPHTDTRNRATDDDDGDDDDDAEADSAYTLAERDIGARYVRSTTVYLCRAVMMKKFGYVRFEANVVAKPSMFAHNEVYNAPYVTPPDNNNNNNDNNNDGGGNSHQPALEQPQRLPQPFIAGGFLFAHGRVAREVAFDPHLPHIFDGEEVLMAVRLWTHGYNLYSPERSVCYHMYGRTTEPKVWDDARAAWQMTQDYSRLRIWYLLRTRTKGNDVLRVPGNTTMTHVLQDIHRYSLGRVRSVEQWYTYANIDAINYSVTRRFC